MEPPFFFFCFHQNPPMASINQQPKCESSLCSELPILLRVLIHFFGGWAGGLWTQSEKRSLFSFVFTKRNAFGFSEDFIENQLEICRKSFNCLLPVSQFQLLTASTYPERRRKCVTASTACCLCANGCVFYCVFTTAHVTYDQ